MNERHKKFSDEYLTNGMNATKAYLSVYPTVKEETAAVNGHKLLRNTKIEAYVKAKREKDSKKLQITRDDIIEKLTLVVDKFLLEGRLTNNALKAIEILNKMTGWNEPEKLDITSKGESIIINYNKPKK